MREDREGEETNRGDSETEIEVDRCRHWTRIPWVTPEKKVGTK